MRATALVCLAAPAFAVVPSFGQTAAPTPYVIDATGKTLGPLLRGNQVILTLPSRRLVQTAFYQTGFVPPNGWTNPLKIYYTASGCSGTPYVFAETLPPLAAVHPEKPTILVYPDPVASRINYLSYRDITALPSQGCFALAGSMLAAPARLFSIEKLNFTPPFTIKLQ